MTLFRKITSIFLIILLISLTAGIDIYYSHCHCRTTSNLSLFNENDTCCSSTVACHISGETYSDKTIFISNCCSEKKSFLNLDEDFIVFENVKIIKPHVSDSLFICIVVPDDEDETTSSFTNNPAISFLSLKRYGKALVYFLQSLKIPFPLK